MPVYLYWGEDTYRLTKAVQALQQTVVDPVWQSFNLDKIDIAPGADGVAQIIQGLNQAMTPPLGMGQRLVWLINSLVNPSSQILSEVERTILTLPATSHLLFTQTAKPDGRSKITKLLQKYAQVIEFALVPAWKTSQILQRAKQVAYELDVNMTPAAIAQLAEAVGNDTRRLYGELEKLKLYAFSPGTQNQPIDIDQVNHLVRSTTQNSLHLAEAIGQGQTEQALGLVAELLELNEPSLKIVAALTRQFRTWLWVKLMVISGEQADQVIAQAAEVSNPKRIYFLKQAVQTMGSQALRQTLGCLLDLEVGLKQGDDPRSALMTKVIEMSQINQATGSDIRGRR